MLIRGKRVQWELRRPKAATIYKCEVWARLDGAWDKIWYSMHPGPVQPCIRDHIASHDKYAS